MFILDITFILVCKNALINIIHYIIIKYSEFNDFFWNSVNYFFFKIYLFIKITE